ncbi:MAG: type VII toxin-antitoxin system HepT family RNase toxin [Bacteroidales bacterium]
MHLEKLQQLENNIEELERFKRRYAHDDVRKDTTIQWALRYGFFESIQIVIDISCHLTAKYNLGNAQTYAECIDLLSKFNYVESPLAQKLKAMAGLRNILVHEYVKVNIEQLYGMLEYLGDFREFAERIKSV